ncbi:MAG: AI-2E family transporter [Oscillospiraceae bacterium]|nr:AI-2E family transporter [Oscillospiraceae bacterium]
MDLSKKNVKKILGIITFAVVLFSASQNLSAVASFFAWILKIVSPIIVGLCLAFILNVLMRVLETKVFFFMANSSRPSVRKALRPISLILTVIIALGILALLMLLIIPQLTASAGILINKFPSYCNTLADWIDGFTDRFGIDVNLQFLRNPKIDWQRFADTAQSFFSIEGKNDILSTTVGVTSSLVSGVTSFLLGSVIAVYVLAEKEKIGRFVQKIAEATLPKRVYGKTREICTVASNSFSSFITGQFTDAALLATMCFIGMSIFRFPSAAVVSVIIGASAIIPVIGPIIGEAISFLIIFMDSPLKALLFLVFILVLQTVDNNLIYPRIVGKSVGLPGLLVLIAVIVGGNIGGILGVLLGVPTASAIYALILNWLNRQNEPTAVTDKPSEENAEDDTDGKTSEN